MGLRKKGVTIRSTIDCLLVQLAEEHGLLVLSRDQDIRRILESGLLRTRAAPLLA